MKKNENTQAATKENTATQTFPMKVDVKIGSIRPTGSIRATASVNLNDCFAIRNVKIIDSSKGLFVAMPSYKAGNGEYKDICFPVTASREIMFFLRPLIALPPLIYILSCRLALLIPSACRWSAPVNQKGDHPR
jgi:DNA-binding cell septation regulator SpoVG